MAAFAKRMDWTINNLNETEANETGTYNEKRAKMKLALEALKPKLRVTLDASRMQCKNEASWRLDSSGGRDGSSGTGDEGDSEPGAHGDYEFRANRDRSAGLGRCD